MKHAVWLLVAALAVLHQDFWWWDDPSPVLGAVPIGLAYHVGISLAAGGVWALVVRYAWPHELERWATEGDGAAERDAA